MKLLSGNGKVLEVRDVGPVIMRVLERPGGVPIQFHRMEVMEDDAARSELRRITTAQDEAGNRLYEVEKP